MLITTNNILWTIGIFALGFVIGRFWRFGKRVIAKINSEQKI